jgi:hypothetical protein
MKENNNKEANSIKAITLATELLEEYKSDIEDNYTTDHRIEIDNSIEQLQWVSTVIQDAIELLEEYTEQDRWQSGDKVIRVINILRNVQK